MSTLHTQGQLHSAVDILNGAGNITSSGLTMGLEVKHERDTKAIDATSPMVATSTT